MSSQLYKSLRIYKSHSISQLLNALFVNRVTSSNFMVSNSLFLYTTSTKIIGQSLTNRIVQSTFGRVFSAGQTEQDVTAAMNQYKKLGVGSIIGYCGEGSLHNKALDSQMNQNAQKLIDAAKIGSTYENQLTQVKISSLVDVGLLKRINQLRLNIMSFWDKHSKNGKLSGRDLVEYVEREVRSNNGLKQSGSAQSYVQQFINVIFSSHKSVQEFQCDKVEFLMNVHPYYYFKKNNNSNKLLRLISPLSKQDQQQLQGMQKRLQSIIQPHQNNTINFLIDIDAQQSYFQYGINSISEQYQQHYNKDRAYIIPTIQNYLKDGKERIEYQIEIAHRRNLFFAMKIVRGAYLTQERRIAAENNRECYVCDTFQQTTSNYMNAVDKSLNDSRVKQGSQIIIAGHNQDTINEVKKMIGSNDRVRVVFAQLKGIGDHITFQLLKEGFPVLKCLAYGKVNIMIPYLIRRAQEMSNTNYPLELQYQLIKDEIAKRMANQK